MSTKKSATSSIRAEESSNQTHNSNTGSGKVISPDEYDKIDHIYIIYLFIGAIIMFIFFLVIVFLTVRNRYQKSKKVIKLYKFRHR